MPYVIAEINDKESHGRLIGRIVRPDNGNVLDYQAVALTGDATKDKGIRDKFKKELDAKAEGYKARIEASERSGITPDTPGKG